jgi:hypothetical protein
MLQLICGPLGDDEIAEDIVYDIIYDIAYDISNHIVYDILLIYDIVNKNTISYKNLYNTI